MEIKIIKNFETFQEFPDGYILIDNKSNYFYIKDENSNYVATKKLNIATNLVTNDESDILLDESYFDIISGECILNDIVIYKSTGEIKNSKNNCKIIPLSTIFNLKTSSKYYLAKEDIEQLTSFEQRIKIKKKF